MPQTITVAQLSIPRMGLQEELEFHVVSEGGTLGAPIFITDAQFSIPRVGLQGELECHVVSEGTLQTL